MNFARTKLKLLDFILDNDKFLLIGLDHQSSLVVLLLLFGTTVSV